MREITTKKISPIRDCGQLLRNLRPFQVRSHVIQKLGQISKIWSIQNLDIVQYSFRISGHLPSHIKNAGGDRFWKLKKIEEFITSKVSDLDLGSGHTAYRRASLYLRTKFHRNRKTFCGRTDIRTDIWPMLLGRLFWVDLMNEHNEWQY